MTGVIKWISTRAVVADIAVLGVAGVWGSSYPVMKGALLSVPVVALIFYRFLIAAVLISVVARRDLVNSAGGDRAVGMVLGAILFSIFFVEMYGVSLTSATNAALIISLCVVFTPLLDFGLKRRLPPPLVTTGALTAVVGVGTLAGGLSTIGTGDWLVLGAAVLRAIMVVATKRLMADRALSSAGLTALQCWTVSFLAITLILFGDYPGGLPVEASFEFWTAVGFLSLFCTVGAFYVQNAAVRRSSPTRVSLLMGTEPVFGVMIASLLFEEPISTLTFFGGSMILCGTSMALASEIKTRS